jgi:hypothetical protein
MVHMFVETRKSSWSVNSGCGHFKGSIGGKTIEPLLYPLGTLNITLHPGSHEPPIVVEHSPAQ